MSYVIDRFEGEFAVLEDEGGNTSSVSRRLIPAGAGEGDCLSLSEQGVYSLNEEETDRLKEEADRLIDDLFI